MDMTRRALVGGVGALALLTRPDAGVAQSADEKAVAEAVEALRSAMLEPDKARLDPLLADQLSYGHSSGRVETKAQFVDSLVAKRAVFKSITISDQTVAVVGNNAVVRHIFSGDVESGGKVSPVKIGILQVWVKQDQRWTLLARQAVPLQG